MLKQLLFSQATAKERKFSIFLLFIRIAFGLLFMIHGYQKLTHYGSIAPNFPDPLHIGSNLSLILAIFAELICSIGFILGFLYRLSMIPMLFTMIIAFFLVHHMQIDGGELAFIYLLVFIGMYIAGPGRYSVDNHLFK